MKRKHQQAATQKHEYPLTKQMISELVRRGWPEKDLQYAAAMGAVYNARTDSLWFPPKFFKV